MITLALILCCLHKVKHEPPVPSIKTERGRQQCEELKARIRKVKEWRTANDYTDTDWVYLLKLSQSVQKMPDNVVSEVMNSFNDLDSRPYLVLKVMFYRPLPNADGYRGPGSGGLKFTEKIKDEHSYDVPIDWNKGYPHLVASRTGGSGRGYGYLYHYYHLRRCYSLRKITIPKEWEKRVKQVNRDSSSLHSSPAKALKKP
ncbi:MAG: hypothetical protein NT023_18040 [Armatimonadetes bacterium]|nr:hypothetical protein [Armatimonadota bacterium]